MSEPYQEEHQQPTLNNEGHQNQSHDFVKVDETQTPILVEPQSSAEQKSLRSSHILVESQNVPEIIETKVGSLTKVDDLFKSQENYVYHPKESNVDSISSLDRESQDTTHTQQTDAATHVQDGDSLASRIARASSLKESARPFVKGGLYDDAIKVYESAFYVLKPTAEDVTSSDYKRAQNLQNDLFNNLSYCFSQVGKYQDAVSYAKRVLDNDRNNVKALFRLTVCYEKLGDDIAAYEQIEKCQDAFRLQNPDKPLDPKIREHTVSLKEKCRATLEERQKKEKELYAKMMGSQRSESLREVEKTEKAAPEPQAPKKSIFSYRIVRYGIGFSLTGLNGYILYRMAKKKAEEEAKQVLPALILAVGALACLKYVRGHVKSALVGLGMGITATLLMQRANQKSG